jgi:hypothetical protein
MKLSKPHILFVRVSELDIPIPANTLKALLSQAKR